MSEFHHKLVQRKVRFDFSDTPLHWVPGEAEASQVMNVLHMLLPSGELWFCRLYNKALPLVSDARLRDDVQGFIRQEAMHSRAHDGAIQRYLSRFDIDSKPFTDKMDFLFERLLCDYPLGQNRLTRALDGWWLRQRCAIIAAVEHFTCVLGKWVLEARELDRRGSDPVMLDLLRWHGAEEVEHRCVAHDLHVHLGGSLAMRWLFMLIASPALLYLFSDAMKVMMRQDPATRYRLGFLRMWHDLGKRGLLPSTASVGRSVLRYFDPRFHPRIEGDLQAALDYLASSPAALRAAAEKGTA